MDTRQNANKISNTEVKTKRSLSEKILSQKQKKKSNDENQSANSRLLITVNVLGSAGPIKFVVNEDHNVAGVIDTALKLYARERRLPVLGSDAKNFLLYTANAGLDALSPAESIRGVRSFVLCKKQRQPQMTEARSEMVARKRSSSWKAWINKSFSFKISSH